MSKAEGKKQEFMSGEIRYRGPNRVIIFSFLLVVIVAVGVIFQMTKDDTVVPRRWEGGNFNIGHPIDYKGQTISMTDVDIQLVEGKFQLPLAKVEEAKIIYAPTEYQYRGKAKAVTALLTPAGRLVVSVAMCEPCRSERFHIQENVLVCDTCGTRWQLNSLQGMSGGCVDYPPEEMPYVVKDGTISFDASLVEGWEPRI